jgi:hypothetical protein
MLFFFIFYVFSPTKPENRKAEQVLLGVWGIGPGGKKEVMG